MATPAARSGFFEEWTNENAAAVPAPPRVRWRRRRPIAAVAVLAATAATSIVLSTSASADPSANTWKRLRVCESGNNYSINTGNDHYGAYQFDVPTWRSVGGTGYPSNASKAEQDARALILYRERGWQPWQCASILGLHEDSDARSGRTGDIHFPTSSQRPAKPVPAKPAPPEPATAIPAFPGGSHWYTYGETNKHIKTFQDQMHKRGYFPVGTGEYGPNTQRLVKQLQRLNGLVPNGYIGPNTWRLAWTGTYH
jgi:hypothetical protein